MEEDDEELYKKRIEKIKEKMIEQKVDIAFITSPINIFYLTGFYVDPMERFYGLILSIQNEENKLFLPGIELQAALDAKIDCELLPIQDFENPYSILRQHIGNDISSFGLEKGKVTIRELENLSANLPELLVVDIEDILMRLRITKTPAEIKNVEKALSIVDKALQQTIANPVIGRSELALSLELQTHLRELGAQRPVAPLVLSGTRSALPHGSASEKKIAVGDFLLFDIVAIVDGYYCDITRTFIVGRPSAEQKEIYETVRQANLRAIAQIEVGKELGAIDLSARDYIREAGYGEYFNHRIGHGLGLDVHERPSIHERNTDKVLPGMLITIEPGIYIPDIGGVRIEDDIYIGLDGKVNVLSKMTKELAIIP